jgi:large subunit ribosomal protein L18e
MKINVEKDATKKWLETLKAYSGEKHNGEMSKRLYRLVAVPRRSRVSVDLFKIAANSKEGDNVIVPGKVLSMGRLDHKVNIAAIEYSREASEALRASGSRLLGIDEMLKMKNVRIIV